jgi:hypothetical protein
MEPSKKRRRLSPYAGSGDDDQEHETTDFKIAVLSSLHPDRTQDVLLDYLLAHEGKVNAATRALATATESPSPRKSTRSAMNGVQSSLSNFATGVKTTTQLLTKKGRTLHLYVSCTSAPPYDRCSFYNAVARGYRAAYTMLNRPQLLAIGNRRCVAKRTIGGIA